jgi:hypothetical protein
LNEGDRQEKSPLRVLERLLGDSLGAGRMAAVQAPSGVGKTAFLVQVGLDAALLGRRVLHVAIDQDVDAVRAFWDELLRNQAAEPGALPELRLLIERQRIVQVWKGAVPTAEQLRRTVTMLVDNAGFRPDVLLFDGAVWGQAPLDPAELKEIACEIEAALWVTARDDDAGADAIEGCADAILALRPAATHIDLRLLRGPKSEGEATPLALHPDTMRLVDQRDAAGLVPHAHPRDEYTVYLGGAPGSEAAFGETAEKYGIGEVNYTFEGHEPARERGLEDLPDRKLRQGDVSLSYVARRMKRTYSESATFRRVLQAIWHQINSAQQVIVVGSLKDDGTVKGGTGWGAELARLWNKPLWVFDQERQAWFRWNSLEEKWMPSHTPRVIATRFAGTGTRFLNEAGRKAIDDVFAVTFGAP